MIRGNQIQKQTKDGMNDILSNIQNYSQLSASVTQEKIKRCKESYFFFLQEFWHTLIKDKPVWNWHIKLLCDEIQDIIERVGENKPKKHDLVVNIPPGTTKSIACSVMPMAWAWLKYPWLRFTKATHSATLSLELAELTRLILQSRKYTEYFSEIRVRRGSDSKSNFRVMYRDEYTGFWTFGGSLLSTSVNGSVTGFHGHIRLTDDPIDPEKAVSEKILASSNRWLEQTYSSRVVDKENTPHILIMQRLAVNDPSGKLLKQKEKGKKIKHICLPGQVTTKKEAKLVQPKKLLKQYKKNKGFLDPKRLGPQALLDMEMNLGQFGYLSQVQQDPQTAGAGMFDMSKIAVLDPEEFDYRANLNRIVRYWDKAGTSGGGAYTAGVKLAELKDSKFKYLIMHVKRGQWGSAKRETIIEETAKQDRVQNHINVTQIVEQEPGSGGKESAENTKKRLAKHGISCLLDRPTGDKVYRADPVTVAVDRGLVAMFIGTWNQDLIDEGNLFPVGTYKDQIDAFSGAYGYFEKENRAGAL